MEKEVIHHVSIEKLGRLKKTTSIDSDGSSDQSMVIGSTKLYDESGDVRLIPAPTPDPKGKNIRLHLAIMVTDLEPKDPLNLSQWRKCVAISAVAFCKKY